MEIFIPVFIVVIGFVVYLVWFFSPKGKAKLAEIGARRLIKVEKLRNAGVHYPSQAGVMAYQTGVGLIFLLLSALLGSAFIPYFSELWGLYLLTAFSFGVAVGGIAHLVARQAAEKGRRYDQFFLLSLLISPVICFLIVASLSNQTSEPQIPVSRSEAGSNDHGAFEKIESLAKLKDKGLITEAEFQSKKEEILKTL